MEQSAKRNWKNKKKFVPKQNNKANGRFSVNGISCAETKLNLQSAGEKWLQLPLQGDVTQKISVALDERPGSRDDAIKDLRRAVIKKLIGCGEVQPMASQLRLTLFTHQEYGNRACY